MSTALETIGRTNEAANRFSKLGVAIASGSVAIASAFAIDSWLAKKRWPDTANQFVGIDPDSDEQAISFGGLGVDCGAALARDASAFLPGSPGHAKYSNKGFSIDQLARKFRQQAGRKKLLHINGHSMGGPVGLETSRVAGIPDMELGHIVLLCSPFDNDDARLGRYIKLLELVRWEVGPGNKFCFSFCRSMLENRRPDEAWRQAKYDAFNGCAPSLFKSQATLLPQLSLSKQSEFYKPLVGPQTKIFYCRPENPLDDIVVDTVQASERYAEFSSRLQTPFEDVLIPEAGHANSAATFEYLAKRQMN